MPFTLPSFGRTADANTTVFQAPQHPWGNNILQRRFETTLQDHLQVLIQVNWGFCLFLQTLRHQTTCVPTSKGNLKFMC